MKLDYNVTIYLEVYHEGYADLLADIYRLENAAGVSISNTTHPIARFKQAVSITFHNILGPKYTTMEDVQRLKQQFETERTTLAKLEHIYAGQLEQTGA